MSSGDPITVASRAPHSSGGFPGIDEWRLQKDRLNARFAALEGRADALDLRFAAANAVLVSRLNALDARRSRIEARLKSLRTREARVERSARIDVNAAWSRAHGKTIPAGQSRIAIATGRGARILPGMRTVPGSARVGAPSTFTKRPKWKSSGIAFVHEAHPFAVRRPWSARGPRIELVASRWRTTHLKRAN